jgi:hypothetical protein
MPNEIYATVLTWWGVCWKWMSYYTLESFLRWWEWHWYRRDHRHLLGYLVIEFSKKRSHHNMSVSIPLGAVQSVTVTAVPVTGTP